MQQVPSGWIFACSISWSQCSACSMSPERACTLVIKLPGMSVVQRHPLASAGTRLVHVVHLQCGCTHQEACCSRSHQECNQPCANMDYHIVTNGIWLNALLLHERSQASALDMSPDFAQACKSELKLITLVGTQICASVPTLRAPCFPIEPSTSA